MKSIDLMGNYALTWKCFDDAVQDVIENDEGLREIVVDCDLWALRRLRDIFTEWTQVPRANGEVIEMIGVHPVFGMPMRINYSHGNPKGNLRFMDSFGKVAVEIKNYSLSS